MSAEQVSSGRVCRPDTQVRLSASVHDHPGQHGTLFPLYGQPCVYFEESGDVHTPHREQTASVLSETLRTPGLQGTPSAFSDPTSILETGGLVLQVGETTAALWPSRFVTDTQWSGRARLREDACVVTCQEAGFSRFTGAFTWLSEERFLLSGESATQPGQFGLRVFRWLRDEGRLAVHPEADACTVLPGNGDGSWRAHMLPVPDTGKKVVVVTAGATLWQVEHESSALTMSGRYQYDGERVTEARVVASRNRDHSQLLMLVTRDEPGLGHAQILEQWVLKANGDVSHEQVHGRIIINDAREVVAGANRLVFTSRASGEGVLHSMTALHDTWCKFAIPAGGVANKVALGPGYVAVVGDYPKGGKRYLWTGTMHRGGAELCHSGDIGDAVEEERLQLLACPGAVVLYASRAGRRRIEVYGISHSNGAA
jgi:hypothetical protein